MAKTLTRGHPHVATQLTTAPGELDGGRVKHDAHQVVAPVDLDRDQSPPEAQERPVPVDLVGGQARPDDHSMRAADALLALHANAVDDLERARIAAENRARSLAQVYGLEDHPEYAEQKALASDLEALEHKATLRLQKAMRSHPLGPFVQRTKGLGLKQAARLLAAIGDPADRPNPAKLWAYCGYAPDQKRRKGVQSNWNGTAKMRAYLCAESCMKQRTSPYRKVYDDARAAWADRDTSDGHKHNHALRLVAKAILLDLWREARANMCPEPRNVAPATSPGEAA